MKKSDWLWPEGQKNSPEIFGEIQEAIRRCRCLPWDKPTFAYPGTAPLPIALEAYKMVVDANSNSIGDHSIPHFPVDLSEGSHMLTELGFLGSQVLEQEAIAQLVRMCGGDPKCIAGYFCEGGTAANLAGMWMGRNYLQQQPSPHLNSDVRIITTPLVHYSVNKAANLLGLELAHVGCNQDGSVQIAQLDEAIRQAVADQVHRVLLVFTAGSTMTGSVDDIGAISDLRHRLELEIGISTYLHVDGALGGFVLPFLEPAVPFGFDRGADSVIIDPHKMGGVPFGCGAILYRSELAKFVEVPAPYLNAEHDWCINGSRSAAPAAALWAALRYYSYEGYAKRVRYCTDLRDYAVKELERSCPRMRAIVGQTNQVCLLLDNDPGFVSRIKTKFGGEPYFMHLSAFPSDLTNPCSSCDQWALKLVFMPHHTEVHVQAFTEALKGL